MWLCACVTTEHWGFLIPNTRSTKPVNHSKKDGWTKTPYWVCQRIKGLFHTVGKNAGVLAKERLVLPCQRFTLPLVLPSDSFPNCFGTSTFWFRRNGLKYFFIINCCSFLLFVYTIMINLGTYMRPDKIFIHMIFIHLSVTPSILVFHVPLKTEASAQQRTHWFQCAGIMHNHAWGHRHKAR